MMMGMVMRVRILNLLALRMVAASSRLASMFRRIPPDENVGERRVVESLHHDDGKAPYANQFAVPRPVMAVKRPGAPPMSRLRKKLSQAMARVHEGIM